jgi:hypothetical protein
VPFNSPDCADYYHKLTKFYKQALEREESEFIQAYSHGWHDGQDVIIDSIKHINLGGDAAGETFFNQEYKNK